MPAQARSWAGSGSPSGSQTVMTSGSRVKRIDRERDEVQPLTTERVFDGELVSGERLTPHDVAQLEGEAFGR